MSYYRHNKGYSPKHRNSERPYSEKRYFAPKIYPRHQIAYETENYFGYINARIKNEFHNLIGYQDIDRDIYEIFGIRLSYIKYIHEDGHVEEAYSRPNTVPLPGDSGDLAIIKLLIASGNVLEFIGINFSNILLREIRSKSLVFLNKYFLDNSNNEIVLCGCSNDNCDEGLSKHLKKKGHSAYSRPHSESITSPIEELMEKELLKWNINFQKQYELRLNDKKFTVIDFFIPEKKLAIYCDGTEFHKDPQRIIMDKQQDRKLQAIGYHVFRFSGSEIIGNITGCVMEISKFLKNV